ncbi:MAG TPA: hypothetical protein VEI02_08405 [Planctomycetota bacterium]|nr:hypothetical protein [Planctomycetota bacterium]
MTRPPAATPPTAPEGRTPEEIRAVEAQVWDFTKHLVHPAALYALAQVVLWIGLEENAAFRAPGFGFWAEAGVHVLQFLGAWAVLYGTLLRDMGFATRVPTLLWWFAAVGAAGAWLWPDRTAPEAATGLRAWLAAQLVAAVAGWVGVYRTWFRARRAHEAAAAEAESREGAA